MNYYNVKPKERINKAVDLLNTGKTYKQVANDMGLSLSQVKYCFKVYTQQGNKLRYVEHGKIKQIMEIFKDEPACSFTAYQVAQILGLKVRTVQNGLHQLHNDDLLDRVYQGHYQWSEE